MGSLSAVVLKSGEKRTFISPPSIWDKQIMTLSGRPFVPQYLRNQSVADHLYIPRPTSSHQSPVLNTRTITGLFSWATQDFASFVLTNENFTAEWFE